MGQGRSGRKTGRNKAVLGSKERRGLFQLTVSLLLFLLVFAGQEAFPEKAQAWRAELTAILQKDTDFQRVFRYLGRSVAEEAPVLEAQHCITISWCLQKRTLQQR